MTERPTLTFLVPVYHEEANVERLYHALRGVMEGLETPVTWELLFTDNHSEDRTFEIIEGLAAQDPRIRCIRFSRNFGFQLSILTGYRHARGEAAIQLDCDLQDPPELIPRFLEAWRGGAKIVYGVRRSRKEGFVINVLRKVFYRLIDFLSEHPIPHDAGDFRLVDRVVINELVKVRDARPYLRGTLAGLGFEQQGIAYDREARTAGESKFGMRALVALALDGILSQSTVPLRIASYVGALVFVTTLLLAVGYLVMHFTVGSSWPAGFTTLTLLLLASISLNAIFLGIIGEYVSRIFHMVRQENEVSIERVIDPRAPVEAIEGGLQAGRGRIDDTLPSQRRGRGSLSAHEP